MKSTPKFSIFSDLSSKQLLTKKLEGIMSKRDEMKELEKQVFNQN
jgi:hypothetical protein